MMYRPNIEVDNAARSGGRRKGRWRRSPLPIWIILPVMVGLVYITVFARRANDETRIEKLISYDDAIVEDNTIDEATSDAQYRVFRRRIIRDGIPAVNIRQIGYRELFNDSNYVQLSAARANGIDPHSIVDPADCEALVPIFSTRFYHVDTMYHSLPYLVPEAVLLLDYISHRYSQIMEARFPRVGQCRPIVTSALRTEQSERRLKRVNRNATDTSAHIYGTTFDLSAQRYEHVYTGHDTVIDACKEALAQALYEIRYEGLCYVKYERNSCFHITLRTTQYEGNDSSEMRSYINPGSPDYLLTKAPPRPKPRAVKKSEKPVVAKQAPKQAKTKQKKNSKQEKRERKKAAKQAEKQKDNNNKPTNTNHQISERERLSLEQFERNY